MSDLWKDNMHKFKYGGKEIQLIEKSKKNITDEIKRMSNNEITTKHGIFCEIKAITVDNAYCN